MTKNPPVLLGDDRFAVKFFIIKQEAFATGAESIKESSTLESSTLAILTLYLVGEGRDHTCAVSNVPSRVEISSFIDSAPDCPAQLILISCILAGLVAFPGVQAVPLVSCPDISQLAWPSVSLALSASLSAWLLLTTWPVCFL